MILSLRILEEIVVIINLLNIYEVITDIIISILIT